jgi:hypothetical protein
MFSLQDILSPEQIKYYYEMTRNKNSNCGEPYLDLLPTNEAIQVPVSPKPIIRKRSHEDQQYVNIVNGYLKSPELIRSASELTPQIAKLLSASRTFNNIQRLNNIKKLNNNIQPHYKSYVAAISVIHDLMLDENMNHTSILPAFNQIINILNIVGLVTEDKYESVDINSSILTRKKIIMLCEAYIIFVVTDHKSMNNYKMILNIEESARHICYNTAMAILGNVLNINNKLVTEMTINQHGEINIVHI